MRIFLALITALTCLECLATNPIPRVPSTIEIAEIKLKITSEAQREIQKDVDALRASEKYFQLKLDRINLYFPLIERVLKEEGVPDDIKYLSVQESALVSDAVSSADAVGYWQFKDFTAREVGLRVDGKIDERKNIVAASRGAAKYFKRNNYILKNWIYSVNAYMTGPAGVRKYVDKRDIGSTRMEINGKTHWYVKRFIAHVIAFKDEVGGPHSEGLKLAEYTKGKNKSLDQIARELKIDSDLLEDYNKWLKHGKIPDDKEYTVIVPMKGRVPADLRGKSDDPPPLTRKIEEPKDRESKDSNFGAAYTMKSIFIKRNDRKAVMATDADNVVSLAEKANILPRQLIKFNDLDATQTIEGGEVYYAQRKRNRAEIEFHVTEHGETLWEISQKYGVKMKKILKKNRMDSPNKLKPGRVLWMRKKRPRKTAIEYRDVKKMETSRPKKKIKVPPTDLPDPVAAKPEAPIHENDPLEEQAQEMESTEVEIEKARRIHIVQPGESLWAISRRYNISVSQIQEWNGLGSTASLHPGQELVLSVKDSSQPEPAQAKQPTSQTYTVQPGDTLYGIARKFDLTVDQLKKLNGKSANELAVGEVLKIK